MQCRGETDGGGKSQKWRRISPGGILATCRVWLGSKSPDTTTPGSTNSDFRREIPPNVAKENELGKQREPSAKIPRATENPTNCNFAHIVNGLGLGGAQEYTMLSLTYKNMWEYTCSAK